MDWIGWIGTVIAFFAALLAWRADARSKKANEIAEAALVEARGPEFAFAVEHTPTPTEARVFRLTNTGWRAVSGVAFESIGAEEPGELFGSFTPQLHGSEDSMASGESVRFVVGMKVPDDDWESGEIVFPAHILVRVAETSRVFRVDMPARM